MKNQPTQAILAIGLLLAATVSGEGADGPSSQENASPSGDYCRNHGERFAQGESSCLVIGEQAVLATCDMSINNPTWRKSEEKCDPQTGSISQ